MPTRRVDKTTGQERTTQPAAQVAAAHHISYCGIRERRPRKRAYLRSTCSMQGKRAFKGTPYQVQSTPSPSIDLERLQAFPAHASARGSRMQLVSMHACESAEREMRMTWFVWATLGKVRCQCGGSLQRPSMCVRVRQDFFSTPLVRIQPLERQRERRA